MKYQLTTPHQTGKGIVTLQKALIARGYLKGAADGDFGPQTAAAVKLAKYWFGYLKRNINGVADDTFQKFLYAPGFSKLRPDMWARRTLRLHAAPKTATKRQRMLALALTQVGVKESPPDSNIVLYTRWYGLVGPWCAMFISWCASQVGLKSFHYSYVPAVVDDAWHSRNGLRSISYAEVIPGDLACYDWNGDGTADHIGIVKSKINSTGFYAVEGNTGIGNDSNGGEVMVRDRLVSEVQAFVRLVS